MVAAGLFLGLPCYPGRMLLTTLLVLALPQQTSPQQPGAAATRVTLTPMTAKPGENLPWSPKGAKVDLRRDGEALTGAFALGPTGPSGPKAVAVRLEHAASSTHFDVLSIDLDRDGKFGAEERLTTTAKDTRGKWWSSFDATVQVPFAADTKAEANQKATSVPYAMALWFVEDPKEPTAPPTLRWSRRGWFEGKAQIGGKDVFVLVSEMALDGVITAEDSWALATDRKLLLAAGPRDLAGHCWLEDRAYRATKIAANGLSLELVPFDPSTTEAEEKANADIYKPDREAKRAIQPLAFATDFAKAQAQAKKDKKRLVVDFATTWCGPCKLMDQFVYTAEDVVNAAKDVVCVKLDGDVERELVKRFAITAYPTMLLLEADGTEVRREVGYQSVAATVKFLAR
jgi:thiol-disulfide isomerase/thioredoxin